MGCRKKFTCDCLDIEYRTTLNWEKYGTRDKRKGSGRKVGNKLTKKEEKEIIKIACQKHYCNLTPYEIVPILAEKGKYIASVRTFYRILKKEGLSAHRGKSKKSSNHTKIEIKATGPNQLLSWDITYLKTCIRGKFYYLYLVIDIWSRMVVGWEIHTEESSILAKELFEKLCCKYDLKGAILHSDNGSPMKNATMADTLEKLGVTQSFSRPSVSNDNAYSESLFKTLKYTAGYPKNFLSMEDAKEWVEIFVNWYNHDHRHSGIGYVTPYQRHTGKDIKIFQKRNEVFKNARAKNPERWSKKRKNWYQKKEVFLKKGNRKKRA